MRRLALVLLIALPLAAIADEPPVTLTVKPLLCIVDQRTPSCEMRFAIYWQSEQTGYYCVLTELEVAPLRCWNEARAGDLDDERTVDESFSYELSDGDAPLAAARVEVLRKDSDDRRRQRRTRHVWDVL